MNRNSEQVLEQALRLPLPDRAELAAELKRSVADLVDAEAIKARFRALDERLGASCCEDAMKRLAGHTARLA
jgi:hypothetical protein